MAITIKDITQTTTFIQSTGTIQSGEAMPRVIFSREGWKFLPKPRWLTNQSPQREGNFKHYNGSGDMIGEVTIYLYGPNRNTDLQTLRDIKEPIHLNADDIDTNITGNYTFEIRDYERNEAARIITVQTLFEEYNN